MTNTTTPIDRGLEQRHAALQRANEIRSARKHMKDRLKHRQLTIHELLDSPEAQTWKLADLLSRQPKWGPMRTKTVMGALRLRAGIRVQDLSDSRRQQLATFVAAENERLQRRERLRNDWYRAAA